MARMLRSSGRFVWMLTIAAILWGVTIDAEAQRRGGPRLDKAPDAGSTRLGLFFTSGFGGDVDFRGRFGGWFDGDPDPTVGFGGSVDYAIVRYFALGGVTRFVFWREENWDNRAFGWNLSLLPRVRYPFGDAEVYLGVPFGLQVNAPPEDFRDDTSAGVGWNVQLLFGGQYMLTRQFGLFAEMGATWFKTRHDIDPVDDYVRVRFRQFTLNLGVAILL